MSAPVDLLAPLCAPLGELPGVGTKIAPLLARVADGRRVVDLLLTLPERYVIRSQAKSENAEAMSRGEGPITTSGSIKRIALAARPRQPSHVFLTSEHGEIDLVFFSPAFLRGMRVGQDIAISGNIEWFHGRLTMPQPDYLVPLQRAASIPIIDPVWPLTAGLFQSNMRKAVHAALERLPDLPEWLDPQEVRDANFPSFRDALVTLHAPDRMVPPEHRSDWAQIQYRARARLACDRLFYDQLTLGMTRLRVKSQQNSRLLATGLLQADSLARFGHRLTGAQQRVLDEIAKDLTKGAPMRRLLQGDVGSGKTIVATLAMLHTAEAGAQAALMAPTELLARQHFETISRLSPVPVAYLSGSVKGRKRRETLAGIADGSITLIIGTHALFQDSVKFAKLGLCVIDEQHRFGVAQRLRLGSKGENANMLVMTATPIPRSLLLTRWGELSVCIIDEKPPGRLPIQTSLHPMATKSAIYDALRRKMDDGAQIYWVCPLIEESETVDIAAAEDRYRQLQALFPGDVGLVHGRQEFTLRQEILDAFREGRYRILVATTVIEVGVDVPRASVMVVEHAERFGLAQLHQLRGRVGRGDTRSFCLLLYDEGASFMAQQRLALLRETEDGFRIAEEDFRMRGGGDIAGLRQTGLPDPRLFQGVETLSLLDCAKRMSDRYLNGATHAPDALKQVCLQLTRVFHGDDAWNLLASG